MIIIHSSNLHWSPLPWWMGRYFKAWREDKDIIGAYYNPGYCLLIGQYNYDTGLWLVGGYKNCFELRLLDKDVVGNVWYAFTAAAARMGTCRPALWPQNIYITYKEKYLTRFLKKYINIFHFPYYSLLRILNIKRYVITITCILIAMILWSCHCSENVCHSFSTSGF